MRLFSNPSLHMSAAEAAQRRKLRNRATIAGLAIYCVGISAWFVAPAFAVGETTAEVDVRTVQEAGPYMEAADPVVIDTRTDETLVLAMGIDAVISSVPGGEYASEYTMVMVGNVIVNRATDPRYPDSVEGVLTAPYQFSCFNRTGVKWVGAGAHDTNARQRALDAAERVIAGEQLLAEDVVCVSDTRQGTVVAQLDGLYFCRN